MSDFSGHDPRYRPCVGLMILNRQGLVFAARRIDTPDAWQMPQGGIDPGESPTEAALREMEEEIGTAKAEIVAEHPRWLSYDLPAELRNRVWGGRYLGQTQKWFALRFTGTEQDIDLTAHDAEFDAWRWLEMDELPRVIVDFKRGIYEDVVAEFRHLAGPNTV